MSLNDYPDAVLAALDEAEETYLKEVGWCQTELDNASPGTGAIGIRMRQQYYEERLARVRIAITATNAIP